ncbi:hypothetical protein [Dokdonella sp.]|uniref:hypothetical protein n=1 Tax=Dokdonella sp. TaxID=2291710 RepID=UPI002DD67497|nr:hypothetical protein [Dokdonella sp.]
MSAHLTQFSPFLQPAVDKMAISPQQAWDLDLLMEMDWEPTQQDLNLAQWVNLVNRPVELCARQ